MSSILNIFRRKFKVEKDCEKLPNREKQKFLDEPSTNSFISITALTPTSSNLTLVSSTVNPLPKAKSSLCNFRFNNNNFLSVDDNAQVITELKSDSDLLNDINEQYLSCCLSGYSKEKYTGDTMNSISYSKEIIADNGINKNLNNENQSNTTTSHIMVKLTEDYGKLVKKNKKLKIQFNVTNKLNNKFKNEMEELENLNKKLLSDNTEVLQEAIKHRFLKLESEDLSKKTDQYKLKLEEKENLIVNFQKQYENLKMKNNIAYKRKEEALLEASHSHIKLKELANDCAKLDIYKCESVQRKYYFNELQNVFGNIRVYLKIKPTIGESCLSFVADDKILITIDEKKPKNLICRFTKVFQPQHNNVDIFDEIQPLLTTVVDGYNCSFINYGQRGSGKSYTFFGDKQNPGILSRAINYLLQSTTEINNQNCGLFVSAIEIFKNSVVDILRKKPVQIFDDGCNLVLKNTEEKVIKTSIQCNEIVNLIHDNRHCGDQEQRFMCHLVVIIRVNSVSKVTNEVECGVAMLCDLAGFDSETNLCSSDRLVLKEEKTLHETLVDLGKTLITLKSRRKRLPRPNTMLTKLLQPCLGNRSKCCFIVHCLSDKDQHSAIVKSIQYGLAVMPKQKRNKIQRKDVIQYEFCDEDEVNFI